MPLHPVSPELNEALKRLPSFRFESAFRRRMANTALAMMPATMTPGVQLEVKSDVARGVRVFLPEVRRPGGALLWIHGGGYVIGRAVQEDRLCGTTALALGIPVVSVDYRLAPKHPFPAAHDDCYAALHWLQAEGPSFGVDPKRIAIGGTSAGGGLAAGLVQRAYDGGGKLAAQWLIAPMLDDRTSTSGEPNDLEHHVWTTQNNYFGWKSYLATEPGAPPLPYAVPGRREDLKGLPPTWIGVGDIDLFWAEDSLYADRLQKAGVAVEFVTAPGAPHGFQNWGAGTQLAQDFLARGHAWLRNLVTAS